MKKMYPKEELENERCLENQKEGNCMQTVYTLKYQTLGEKKEMKTERGKGLEKTQLKTNGSLRNFEG